MTPDARRAIEWECTRLINLYANLNDAGRWHDVAALYVADGVMARPAAPDVPIVGREAILASFLARPPRASQHICANIVVDVIGESEAAADSTILLFTGAAGEGALPRLDPGPPKIGRYRDRLVETPDGWRFAARRGALLFDPAS